MSFVDRMSRLLNHARPTKMQEVLLELYLLWSSFGRPVDGFFQFRSFDLRCELSERDRSDSVPRAHKDQPFHRCSRTRVNYYDRIGDWSVCGTGDGTIEAARGVWDAESSSLYAERSVSSTKMGTIRTS